MTIDSLAEISERIEALEAQVVIERAFRKVLTFYLWWPLNRERVLKRPESCDAKTLESAIDVAKAALGAVQETKLTANAARESGNFYSPPTSGAWITLSQNIRGDASDLQMYGFDFDLDSAENALSLFISELRPELDSACRLEKEARESAEP